MYAMVIQGARSGRTTRDRTAGRAVALALVGIGTFQVALAAGAPWGSAAWGGTHHGVLPTGLRAASGGAAIVLLLAAGVADGRLLGPSGRRRLLLVAAIYLTLGVALNAASRSKVEAAIWAPVCAVAAALAWRAVRASRHAAAPAMGT
jgi:hypothetical protein